MKRILPVVQVGLGILALVLLVVVLNSLFQSRTAETAAQRTPTGVTANATRRPTREGKPTPKPTKTQKITWKTTTLDQIYFEEPKSVYTNSGMIKIHNWLPDNRTLLLELEDPAAKDKSVRYRIVTLDTESGALSEYGQREDSSYPPIWIEKADAVAFMTHLVSVNGSSKLMLGFRGNSVREIDEGDSSLGMDPNTGNLIYLKQTLPSSTMKLFDAAQESFLPPPLRAADLPWGQIRIDPNGKWIASFWGRLSRSPLYLARLDTQTVRSVEVESVTRNEPAPGWPVDVAWSRNGKKLAVVSGFGDGLLSSSNLSLLNPGDLKWKNVNLPAQFVAEIEWAPANRFMLARGVTKGLELSDAYSFWLVDTKKGISRKISYFPPNTFPEFPFMAWSDNGHLAWIKGTENGIQVVITKVLPRR